MNHPPFRAMVSFWLMVCMLLSFLPLGCHSLELRHPTARRGQPYLPQDTEERFKECAALVHISQKADGTTTFTRSDGVSVTYDKAGFPDFTPYRHPTVKDVQIEFTGNYDKDFGLADKAAGITEKMRKEQEYTWHHHQDGKTMQLIKKDVHKDFFHSGGMAGTR